MGQVARKKPARLGEKLLQIRLALNLSQNGIIQRLGFADELSQSNISGFERGVREPSLLVILEYARIAGVSTDVLIDDNLDLPEHIPDVPEHNEWIMKREKRQQ